MTYEARGGAPAGFYVTYLEGEGPFIKVWAQMDNRTSAVLETMLAGAAPRLERSAPPPPTAMAPGHLLGVKWGGNWYRGRVVAPARPPKPLKLRFIDFGHCESVGPDDVRLLDEELAREPAQAGDFLLAEVIHPAGNWEEHVIDYLRTHVYGHDVKLSVKCKVHDRILASLRVSGGDLAEVIINNHIGVKVNVDQQMHILEKYISAARFTPEPSPSLPVAQIQPKLIHNAHPARPLQSRLSAERPAHKFSPLTYKGKQLELNSEHAVYVTDSKGGPEVFAIRLKSDDAALASISREILTLKLKNLESPPVIGTVCLGKHSEDSSVRRAIVTGMTKLQCDLYFVDYGTTETISCYNIYHIPEDLVVPNVLAMRFSLAGLKELIVNEKLIRAFQSLVDGKILTIRVMNPDGPPLVQYGRLYLNGNDVTELLKTKEPSALCFEKILASQLRGSHEVSVSSVDSCSKFYIRLLRYNQQLDELMQDVQNWCDECEPLSYLEIKPGVACCAFYPDDSKWYRAQIINLRKDRVTVKYMDYGNDGDVSLNEIKPIDKSLLRLKAQAVECSLNEYQSRPFDKQASDRLEELTVETDMRMNVCGSSGHDSLLIELFNDNLSPPDIVQHLKMQISSERPKVHEITKTIQNDYAQNQDYNSRSDSYRRNSENAQRYDNRNDNAYSSNGNSREQRGAPNTARYRKNEPKFPNDRNPKQFRSPKGYQDKKSNFKPRESRGSNLNDRLLRAQQSDDYKQNTFKNDNPYRGDNNSHKSDKPYRGENSYRNENSFRNDNSGANSYKSDYSNPSSYKQNKPRDFNKRDSPQKQTRQPNQLRNPIQFSAKIPSFLPKLNDRTRVKITWYVNPDEFYIQIDSQLKIFNAMMNKMPTLYKGIAPFDQYIPIGSPVVVQSPSDNVLYRAEIKENIGNSEYIVSYIDFGNQETIKDRVWKMDRDLSRIPKMALKCSMYEIKHPEGKWSSDCPEERFVNADFYDCVFHTFDSITETFSVSLFNPDGKSVEDLLIQANFAVRNKTEKAMDGEPIDFKLLVGQKFHSKFIKIDSIKRFYLCLDPTNSNADICNIMNLSNGMVECFTECESSEEDFKNKLDNVNVICRVNDVQDERLHVTLYDSGTGSEIFNGDSSKCELISMHPVFNDNLGVLYVSHVETKEQIYLQRSRRIDALATLLADLYQFYNPQGDSETELALSVGELCAVKSCDDNWYRARITEVLDGKRKVNYLDYGNSEIVNVNCIKMLDSCFFNQPRFALCCKIRNDVIPETELYHMLADKELQIELDKTDSEWLCKIKNFNIETAAARLSKVADVAAKTDELIEVYISHIDSPGQFWLQRTSTADKLDSINRMLEDAENFEALKEYEIGTQCVAKYSAFDAYYRGVILDLDNEIITIRFVDFGNTDVLNNTPGVLKCVPEGCADIETLSMKCSVNATPAGMGEWTEQATELFTRSVGDVDKPIRAKVILKDATTYVDLIINNVDITKVLVDAGFAIPTDAQCNTEPITCYASHINSPSEFWIQLDTAVNDLERVSDQLSDAENFPLLTEVEEEVICAARYPEDNLWYRAKVIIKVSNGTEVLFMDYGNASLTSELRYLPDNLKTLPALSRKCALQKPAHVDTWSKAAEKRFIELAAEGATAFKVVFIASGDISIVDLLIGSRSITEELIELCKFEETENADGPNSIDNDLSKEATVEPEIDTQNLLKNEENETEKDNKPEKNDVIDDNTNKDEEDAVLDTVDDHLDEIKEISKDEESDGKVVDIPEKVEIISVKESDEKVIDVPEKVEIISVEENNEESDEKVVDIPEKVEMVSVKENNEEKIEDDGIKDSNPEKINVDDEAKVNGTLKADEDTDVKDEKADESDSESISDDDGLNTTTGTVIEVKLLNSDDKAKETPVADPNCKDKVDEVLHKSD